MEKEKIAGDISDQHAAEDADWDMEKVVMSGEQEPEEEKQDKGE